MANKLDRSPAIIEKYLESTAEQAGPVVETPEPEPEAGPQPIDVLDLMARKSDRGAVAMTQAAAMADDERRKQRADKPPPSGRYKDCIHIIRKPK